MSDYIALRESGQKVLIELNLQRERERPVLHERWGWEYKEWLMNLATHWAHADTHASVASTKSLVHWLLISNVAVPWWIDWHLDLFGFCGSWSTWLENLLMKSDVVTVFIFSDQHFFSLPYSLHLIPIFFFVFTFFFYFVTHISFFRSPILHLTHSNSIVSKAGCGGFACEEWGPRMGLGNRILGWHSIMGITTNLNIFGQTDKMQQIFTRNIRYLSRLLAFV